MEGDARVIEFMHVTLCYDVAVATRHLASCGWQLDRATTLAELFRAPCELTYKGGFHDAKVHAARLSRWLVVNVQAGGEFVSHLDRAKLPAVLFVDPVTGQLMKRLHHVTDASDLLVAADKFTERKPAMPIRANRTIQPPTRPSPNHQEQPAPANAEQEKPTAAVAAASRGGMVCKLRVRLPDGQVVIKEFDSKCGVHALFAYCWSAVGVEQPFRVMAGAKEEVREDKDVCFEQLGLNMSTVSVLLD
ncbi:hypothetical protein E2562_033590 [Oryza meyeriana var. granulata]|uniref:UBX domain-containing protein n=1 Tax=Oryza meyeriana var. granulata TaxID=110450 RepID=A0A6G1D946_9ORYZ|nr:hypothetical protein E2562_033590 [Oryza meyeriana var. granulata]